VRVAIVGGGVSGLAAAHLAATQGHDVVLVDDRAEPGGLIASARRDGFLCERGPQAVLDGAPETRALIASAGLADAVQPASPAARRRFVYVAGALRPFPTSPPALLKTSLLDAGAKLRLFAEPFVPRGRSDGESVYDFVARRFGAQAARRAAAPALIGVYAGDAATLSVEAALPRLKEMEREHGSILRALMRKAAAGMGRAISFPDGLGQLTAALAASLGPRRKVARAMAIEPVGQPPNSRWRIAVEDTQVLEAERLILATPAATTAALLAPLAPAAAEALRAIPHAPVAVVCVGFRSSAAPLGPDLDAYGFVVARDEGIRLLGCQYESSVFPGRAPPGGVLIRALLGGTFHPDLVDADDAAITGQALADLRRAAGLARDPDFTDVWRARPGIPQYDLEHRGRRQVVDEAVSRLSGLAVIGNALRGVGVADCIRAATSAVANLENQR
jgi:protoporphyrinogen/coproporphyrinogen III oxidase